MVIFFVKQMQFMVPKDFMRLMNDFERKIAVQSDECWMSDSNATTTVHDESQLPYRPRAGSHNDPQYKLAARKRAMLRQLLSISENSYNSQSARDTIMTVDPLILSTSVEFN